MKQAKKVITRLLMNNWGGISHQLMEFNEYVNLFSGKSGSGKSTVIDAIQVVLYGSVSSSFLNKAADDSRNKRTVMSYLRGAQKDGSSNREGEDFCAQIVMEVRDAGTGAACCFGVSFEVGKNDRELRKYRFFSHSGPMPEDLYLSDGKFPYAINGVKKLVDARKASPYNGRARSDINRVYPTNQAYTTTLYDEIFGYVEQQRMITMEKSAIALRMTDGTARFIRDYMFPRSENGVVGTISEQLRAYRDIREQVTELENKIGLLEDVHAEYQNLLEIQTDQRHIESVLKHTEVESRKRQLAGAKKELDEISRELEKRRAANESLKAENESLQNSLADVHGEMNASDYGRKKSELKEMEDKHRLLSANAAKWEKILSGLSQWDENGEVSQYLNNDALNLIGDIAGGNVSEKKLEKLRMLLGGVHDDISREQAELRRRIGDDESEMAEKKEMLEEMNKGKKPYDRQLRRVRDGLQEKLDGMYGGKARVYVFADLFDIVDENWRNAVEGRLGRLKLSLITAPEYSIAAAKAFRNMRAEGVDLIDSKAIVRDTPKAREGSLYEAVKTEEPYVDMCLKHYLGGIIKCQTVEELHGVQNGVTPDCYSYNNYIFRHLRKYDYVDNAFIGTKLSKSRKAALADEIEKLRHGIDAEMCSWNALREADNYETLKDDTEYLMGLAAAAAELEECDARYGRLQSEVSELENGTYVAALKERERNLQKQKEKVNAEYEENRQALLKCGEEMGGASQKVADLQSGLDDALSGFVENADIQAEVLRALEGRSENLYFRDKKDELARKKADEQNQWERLGGARQKFNIRYATIGLSGFEKKNDAYDRLLEKYRTDYEPKFKEPLERQYEQVYQSLRENVIATIHGEIKAARRHRREINGMLSRIRFADSIYEIDILPADGEFGQFYDMLTAKELDSKVVDNLGFAGQMSLGDDEFYGKYESQITRFIEKFMPSESDDPQKVAEHRQKMEKYIDYRNYLSFKMNELTSDDGGGVRKISVDDMAGKDSGGEGQNPKYVALLAGFAMLYMQQTNRDSKVRIVLLDEAFSKMDKERSEVCLKYARALDLQLIVCVPDERLQSLIRNVDSVYGFCRRNNRISMMHIDKGDYLSRIEGNE